MNNPYPLGPVFGGHHQGEVESELGDSEPVPQGRYRYAVPGQLAVVVAREDEHVVVGLGGEGRNRRSELGMDVEDPPHLGWTGQHLEPVPGDDERRRPGHASQHRRQFIGNAA